MKRSLDIQNWERKDHFEFFRKFDEPFFGVTFNVDVTNAYSFCKSKGISFFIFYLHKCLNAVNGIKSFGYRIEGDEVLVYDRINASPTINRPDGTFGFSYIDYHEDFEVFMEHAVKEIEKVRSEKGLNPSNGSQNTIHFSTLPWLNFTSVSHARHYGFKDSIPKISFGKVTNQGNEKVMPVSTHVNHALMDGYDVGCFQELFQEHLNKTNQ